METDWDKYYKDFTLGKILRITRNITLRNILYFIKKYRINAVKVAELGGANSYFIKPLIEVLKPEEIYLFDKNGLGLNLAKNIYKNIKGLRLVEIDLLAEDKISLYKNTFNFVYSVGLIEHFQGEYLNKIVKIHFDLLKPQSFCIMTFPIPTFSYRVTRKILEVTKKWIFHDEVPLTFDDVEKIIKRNTGKVLMRKIVPIPLTQTCILCKKGY